MSASIDQQFIEYIVKSLVGKPDAVKIERTIDEKGVLLSLTVDPEDLGRVIGKRGATAQSLRTLLRALGTKNDARYNLKIIDNGEPRPPRDDNLRNDSTGSLRDNKPKDDQPANDQPADNTATPVTDAADVQAEEVPTLDIPAEDEATAEEPAAPEESHSDILSRTRRELADMDDLDV